MNIFTIIVLCIACFGAGTQVSRHYYYSSLDQIGKHINNKRLETIQTSVKQANGLLKSHRKDIATGKAKFRASEWGVSLDM